MSAKKNQAMTIRTHILHHPTDSIQDIIEATGASRRMVFYVKQKLRKEGTLPPSRRDDVLTEKPTEEIELITLGNKTLSDLSQMDLEAEFGNEDETRTKLLIEVQKIAFNAVVHPDTRLSAIGIWVKLKDIAKTKDLGPGPPRTETEIIDRLVMMFKAVGPKLVVSAIEIAFRKESPNETAQVEQETAPSGAAEASSSA